MLPNTTYRSLRTLACAFALTVGVALPGGPAGAVEIGETPPDYLGKTRDGQRIQLSESAGKITIVTFWATWCAPCLQELPVLNVVQKKGGADRIQVVAVNINDRKSHFIRSLRAFKGYEIKFVFDSKGRVSEKYGVDGIPHMLIVDVDGSVAYQHIGYSEKAIPKIVGEINELLVRNNMSGGE